jgi:hypothetical protein
MDPSAKRRIRVLAAMSVLTLVTAMRSIGWENIRAVDALLLFSAGLCGGAAIATIVQARRSSQAKEAA